MEIYRYADTKIEYKHMLDMAPDNTAFVLHTHTCCEVMYFVSGQGSCHIEGTEYNLEPGDLFICRPMESHFIEMKNNVPYERVTMYFPETLFDTLDPEHQLMLAFVNRAGGSRNLYKHSLFKHDYFSQFRSDIERKGGESYIQPMLYMVLTTIRELFEEGSNDAQSEETLETRVLRYVNRHLSEKMSVEMFARDNFISPSQLERRIKNVTGTTLADYINEKRLAFAQSLLAKGEKPTKIYRACGFGDYSSFYRAYVKRFGLSPASRLS